MRSRVTLAIALALLTACSLSLDLDGLSGGSGVAPGFGDSGPTNQRDAEASSSSSSGSGSTSSSGADASIESGSLDASPDVAAPGPDECSDVVVVGNNELTGAITDGIGPGAIDIYGYKAKASALTKCAWVYIVSAPNTGMHVGVYQDNGSDKPSLFLGHAFVESPKVGWNQAKLDGDGVKIASGTVYWLGLSGITGVLELKEHPDSSCGSLHMYSGGTGDSTLPTPFPANPDSYVEDCNALVYLSTFK